VAWQTLWEEVLEDSLTANEFVNATVVALDRERDELVAQQVPGLLRGASCRFFKDSSRAAFAPDIEAALWRALEAAPKPRAKGRIFPLCTSGVQRRSWCA